MQFHLPSWRKSEGRAMMSQVKELVLGPEVAGAADWFEGGGWSLVEGSEVVTDPALVFGWFSDGISADSASPIGSVGDFCGFLTDVEGAVGVSEYGHQIFLMVPVSKRFSMASSASSERVCQSPYRYSWRAELVCG